MMTYLWTSMALNVTMALLLGYMIGQVKVFTDLINEGVVEYTGRDKNE